MLIADEKDPEKTHYVWIKDLARMLYKNSSYEHANTHAAAACTSSQVRPYWKTTERTALALERSRSEQSCRRKARIS